jgi:hypothetical protein
MMFHLHVCVVCMCVCLSRYESDTSLYDEKADENQSSDTKSMHPPSGIIVQTGATQPALPFKRIIPRKEIPERCFPSLEEDEQLEAQLHQFTQADVNEQLMQHAHTLRMGTASATSDTSADSTYIPPPLLPAHVLVTSAAQHFLSMRTQFELAQRSQRASARTAYQTAYQKQYRANKRQSATDG